MGPRCRSMIGEPQRCCDGERVFASHCEPARFVAKGHWRFWQGLRPGLPPTAAVRATPVLLSCEPRRERPTCLTGFLAARRLLELARRSDQAHDSPAEVGARGPTGETDRRLSPPASPVAEQACKLDMLGPLANTDDSPLVEERTLAASPEEGQRLGMCVVPTKEPRQPPALRGSGERGEHSFANALRGHIKCQSNHGRHRFAQRTRLVVRVDREELTK
jgi:hypothetical protein